MKKLKPSDLKLEVSDITTSNQMKASSYTDKNQSYCCDTDKDGQCKTKTIWGTCQTCEGKACETETCVCQTIANCATRAEAVCATDSRGELCCPLQTYEGDNCGTSAVIECPSVQICQITHNFPCYTNDTDCVVELSEVQTDCGCV